jgi:hypothetical protein
MGSTDTLPIIRLSDTWSCDCLKRVETAGSCGLLYPICSEMPVTNQGSVGFLILGFRRVMHTRRGGIYGV